MPRIDAEDAFTAFKTIETKLSSVLEPLREDLQIVLDLLEGRSFGYETNQALIEAIQDNLQRFGLRVCCPRCGAAAIPRCRATQTAKDGSFQFEHYHRGRQTNHGGGTRFPALKLIAAPPDRRRLRKKRKKA